jgi:hypothetical protein
LADIHHFRLGGGFAHTCIVICGIVIGCLLSDFLPIALQAPGEPYNGV